MKEEDAMNAIDFFKNAMFAENQDEQYYMLSRGKFFIFNARMPSS